ncbi:outer membrane-stress sensor serine endopeptidase DegS [Actinobacillus pleuropneumoniae]|uniref:Protease DegS n=3 Tax=Actinobacillus pleuropneumoniae TaxID=715 RepID=A3N0A6_ACTP2|nr:outer membrane-stress sensor serine endopeptidase DegS [Actinobacillus pleuropneumoniae]ABN73842.1 protease DegS precursor [Actinobacillus pleuropneumoniae serovar 5b str. L20]EFL78988.1 protease DegS precursor [Actinobacillus pleuropneumoniae serovar 2 str. 4226]EFL79878.1 protease DegS precursor [Actinobacillus pleuropneumoniae serovar 6 str. Femo]EFM87917.1 Protease DegS [Actinobacillus pleuropneumoniae serovar 2 str. S1536]EFM90099.1 Protease DegS [Actinobacillus pleuropneumoniae serova
MVKKIVQAIALGLFCAFLIIFVSPLLKDRSVTVNGKTTHIESYHDAVQLASPAVVNVYNHAFSQDGKTFEVKNLGSGVIMTSDGYILTNKHVVQNAAQIIVALQTGSISNAKLVGDDTLTDLAVLKIEADNLPTIPQNNERPVRIGDVVLAIGNPFNLGQSITQGIISATGRNALTDGGRQNFIQTDASINRGNSGGALVNSAGELIGINTLSLGKTSDELAEGLNFAIPINLATQIMSKIIQDGRVIRGYFGVNSSLYSSIFDEEDAKGVLITGVAINGPAYQAGIEENDRILKVGEVDAVSPTQMMDLLGNMKPGAKVQVKVLRDGKEFDADVVIGEFPEL